MNSKLIQPLALCCALTAGLAAGPLAAAEPPDLILHNGQVITVDDAFSIRQAMAVRGEWIVAVGTNEDVLKLRGDSTEMQDLGGKTVLPGLFDSHVHPTSAAMHEFEYPVPEMETIQDVLDYVAARADKLDDGQWITLSQVFITRLREQRYPTRRELDAAAPRNPVVFATGPDASINSLALERSGIDKDYRLAGTGRIERDPLTGEPTGILRSCTRILKIEAAESKASDQDRRARLKQLFADYNSVGITAIADRNADEAAQARYQELLSSGELSVRIALSRAVGTDGDLEQIQENIRKIAADPLHDPSRSSPRLKIIGIKTFLDGGMLTGSAYMRQPWGVSEIYSIRDPDYRGVLMIPRERLLPIVRTTVESGLQFTAHSVGDGAVHLLLDVYEEVNMARPIKETRPCITHCNFMSREAVEQMARLGVVADIQPAWLYLDARTLHAQFGDDRLRYFQPLKTMFELGAVAGGGSDHMQKIGSLRSVNPYNPWLGMWITLTRQARWFDGQLHPVEALSREQAIRLYTCNNAHLLFLENEVGSLAAGKRADFVVIDRDVLTCPVDDLKETRVLKTYVDGKLIFVAK